MLLEIEEFTSKAKFGAEDNLVGKALRSQSWQPEFESQDPCVKGEN